VLLHTGDRNSFLQVNCETERLVAR
jgi:hypothetical protein